MTADRRRTTDDGHAPLTAQTRPATYEYQPQVLAELETHGIRPRATTPPELVHEFVSDLYRFELRRLRARQVSGAIPKRAYSTHVVELRKKYILVSIPVRLWTTSAEVRDADS